MKEIASIPLEYLRKQLLDHLYSDLAFFRIDDIKKPIPWYKQAYNRLHWHTVGKFCMWLHQDCE